MQIAYSLQSQIKNFFYTGGPFVPSIIQSVFEQTEDTIINIPLNINFFHLIKSYPNIALTLINEYNKFIKSLNQVIFEISFEEIMRTGSQYFKNKISNMTYHDFNCNIQLKDCLIKQSNIKNIDFIDQIGRSKEGKLIYLNNCLIVEVLPSEMYLYQWVQSLRDCSCIGLVKNIKKSQSFIDVLSNGMLKERSKQMPEICEFCDRVFQICEIKDQVYLSCQKIKVLSLKGQQRYNSRTNSRCFQNSITEVYLNSNKINSLVVGDCIDLYAHFSTQQRIKSLNFYQKIKIQQSFLLICIQYQLSKSAPNFKFFNSISYIDIQHSPCNSNDYLKLYNNYKQIIQAVNQVKFQFSQPKTFTFLKLSLLSSLFMWHPYSFKHNQSQQSLNILIITDEEAIIKRTLKLDYLQYREFPKVYDIQSISLFLLSCHNCVLIFTNPSKKQFQYVDLAIRGQIGQGKSRVKVNITVWVIVSPMIKPKQVLSLEMFNIILDITFIENVNNRQVNHQIGQIIDMLITNYSPEPSYPTGTAKAKRRYRQLSETIGRNEKPSKKIEIDPAQNIDGLQFLQKYYLTSRQHKKTNISNLISLKRAAVGISSMRKYFSGQKGSDTVDFGDALISIFLDEETSRNKRGNSNTLLANEIAKFMLDEKDEMTVNQYVFYEEDFEEVRRTVHKSAVFIRIVDELKRIVRNQNIT